MTLELALVIKGDASGGKSALDATATGLRAVGGAAQDTGKPVSDLTANLGKNAAAHAGLSTQAMSASHAVRGMAEQLAMGISPLQAITAQMNHLSFAASGEGGLVGAFKGVGAAFAPMLTLPNLVAIGLVGAGIAAVSLFEQIAGSGERNAEAALKRQKDLIDQIASAYPQAGKALKDYLDSAHAITPNALVVQSQDQIDAAKAQLAALTSQISNMTSNTGGGRSGPSNPLALQPELLAEIRDMVREFQAGDISAGQLGDKLAGLELNPNLPPGVKGLIEGFISVASKINDADATAKAFSSTLDAINAKGGLIIGGDFDQLKGPGDIIAKLKAMTPDLRTDAQKATDLYTQNSGVDADGSVKTQLNYTLQQIAAQKAQQDATAAAKTAASQAKAQQTAIDGVNKSLNQQIAALGMTDRQQAEANALTQAGIGADNKAAAGIIAKADALYDQRAALTAVNQAENFLGQTLESSLASVLDGTQSATDAMLGFGKAILSAALQAELLGQGPLAGLLGTAPSTSGGLGGILGSVFSLFTGGSAAAGAGAWNIPTTFQAAGFYPGFNAAGTDSWRGGLSWVGENGPELMNLPQGAQVIPADRSAAMMRGGGDTNVFNIQTPSPRKFAESPAVTTRAASRLVARARRYG